MVEGEFHVVAHCPVCGVPAEAWLDEVPAPDLTAESAADAISTGDIELECETCGNEFPVTVTAHLFGRWEAHLTDDPKTKVEIERLDYSYDDWLEDMEPEPHPREIFDAAIGEWFNLLRGMGDRKSGAAGINRMLLVQLFSILEAYLSDAVIKLAFDDLKVAKAIVESHPELKKQTVTLIKVASEPNFVRDTVIAQLRQTQFHRFEFLNGILHKAIGHYLLPKEKVMRDLVLLSVQNRHHCVHRNGRDADGNTLDSLTIDYLTQLAGCFMAMVADLAPAIEELEAKRNLSLDVPW
ncbi:hypothetical protein BFX40_02725 [Mesorhizobium sp. SEMIA 3007]|uniref:hypothetical protein n=1 Tax=Mesorhizobium TaxID=68287 RepID=UPI00049AD6E1|nr:MULTISPECIES: hypothetical protein [Mesorhizobium]AID30463.1 hypothetical protein MCHK_2653 [Mesorhizobium huakuii 7653R]MCH4559643.1 hypothetical protein [Mesorhizobium jarvisii]ODA91907.1 hypothetical protein BFX40_02725 [Mesorhizobium sp. SEMIA 3007]